jgi:PAS domain S-box-containing protein
MFGMALLLSYRRRAVSVAQVLTMIAGFWALVAIIGYTYQAEELFGIARYTGIAFPTAVALFVLCLGILASCVDAGILSIVCEDSAAGIMSRRLAIVGIATPLVLGWLRLEGQRAGHFDLGFGTALLVSAIIIVFLLAIWRAALKLKHIEQQRVLSENAAAAGAERLLRLAALIELSYEPIFVFEMDKGIIEWNRGCEQLYGYSKSEAIGQRSHDLLRTQFPESLEADRKRLEREGYWSGELRHTTKDGREVLVESRQQLLESPSQRLVLETCRDITQRKQAEQEREQSLLREHDLRVEAESAARSKDEFLATVSHELRTPLNAILGWATMLTNSPIDEVTTTRAIEAIERNAKSQAQLIEDLLDVSRIISGNLRLDVKSIALTSVIKAAMDSVQPAADAKEIQLQIIIDPTADNTRGDAARLQQVIWNLLANSIKFTPKGGKISVKVERSDSMAQITVTDTGDGIPRDFLPFVFDRFKQADGSITRKHAGLGLGLAIARHLVELHGGTIEADSAGEGLGAVFKVSLPIGTASVTEIAPADSAKRLAGLTAASESPDLIGIRILVVDDEPDAREMLRAVFERSGADVITASSARDALEVLPAVKPNVLVSDIGMPDEDGYALIRKIRALPPEEGGNIPAIALTGYVRVEERMRALEAGYQMFVPKPVEASELGSIIAGLVAPSA